MHRLFVPFVLAVFALSGRSLGQVGETSLETPIGVRASDWTSIQAAHAAAKFRATKCESGIRAYNPGQRWFSTFDGQGFLVEPKNGAWSWGLRLESYGFAGSMVGVPDGVQASAQGNRIHYDWNADLQEWYINDSRGLEHGYTLARRPRTATSDHGPLVMELQVRGPLSAQISPSGMGAIFLDADGAQRVTYTGLKVFDADGVTQPVRFEGEGQSIRLVIDESQARYPLTIDPIAEQAYLKASNTEEDDMFGQSVAISGDWAVVGAHQESSDATGVNGDQTNNDAIRSGAAYVFRRTGGSWSQEAYLKASNTEVNDQFGFSVAVSGSWIAVGARNEESNATGINGDQSDNSLNGTGAVYLFEYFGGAWIQRAYVKASNTGNQDGFGDSVALSGGRLVVGASSEDSDAIGVNGDQNNENARSSGAAYVFVRSAGVWSQQAYLKASNGDEFDAFGFSVGISGGDVIIGAPGEDSDGSGPNNGQSNDDMTKAGSAYVFGYSSGVWTQRSYLKASNPGAHDQFGFSVGISTALAVVGAPREKSGATGVDGNQLDDSENFAGAAYVFERIGGVWSQQAYLKASNTEGGFSFGHSVAASNGRILIGSPGEKGLNGGIDGNQTDLGLLSSGAAYMFERSAGGWGQTAFIKSLNSDYDDEFGHSVSMSGDLAIVGAWNENSDGTGVNSDGSINVIYTAGAAYIFDLEASIANYCGTAENNSLGTPGTLAMSGSLTAMDNDFTLHASGLPLNQFGYILNSMGRAFTPNPGGSEGNLCLGGGSPLGRHNRMAEVGFSGTIGSIDVSLDLTDMPTGIGTAQVLAGETWNFQCWYRDANPSSTSNFTDGLSILFE